MKGVFLSVALACASFSTFAIKGSVSQVRQMYKPSTIDAMRDFLVKVDESFFDPIVYSPQVAKELANLKAKAKRLVIRDHASSVIMKTGRDYFWGTFVCTTLGFVLYNPVKIEVPGPAKGHYSEWYMYPSNVYMQRFAMPIFALTSLGIWLAGYLLGFDEASKIDWLANQYNQLNPLNRFILKSHLKAGEE